MYGNVVYGQQIRTKADLKDIDIVRSVVKTSPFATVVGPIILTAEYRFAFEHIMSKNQSLQLSLSYLGKSIYTSLIEKASSVQPQDKLLINGVRVQLSYRLFLQRTGAPEGLYIAPHFSYSYCEFSTKYLNNINNYIKAIFVNYNITSGYQFIYNNIAVDGFAGIGYRDNAWIEHYRQTNTVLDDSDIEIYSGHLKIILGINVGYVF